MKTLRLASLALCGLLALALGTTKKGQADEGIPAPIEICDITGWDVGTNANGDTYISVDISYTTTKNNETIYCEIMNNYAPGGPRWEAMTVLLTNNTSLPVATPSKGKVTFYYTIDPTSDWSNEILVEQLPQSVWATLEDSLGVVKAQDTASPVYTPPPPPPAFDFANLRDDGAP